MNHGEPRSILLIHPDAPRRDLFAAALRRHRVQTLDSAREISRMLELTPPEVVVSHHHGARRLIKDLDAHAPRALRLFLRPGHDSDGYEELVEAAAEGHLFHTLDGDVGPRELEERIHTLIRLRGAFRSTGAQLQVQATLHGAPVTGTCLDLSSTGVGFQVPLTGRPERFLPGARLEHFRIGDGARELVVVPSAVVRQVAALGGGRGYRVGVAFEAEPERPFVELRGSVVSDPVRVLATLRRAIRRGERLSLRRADAELEWAELVRPALQCTPDGWKLISAGRPRWLQLSTEPAELLVELGGLHYRGTVVLIGVGSGVVATMPRTLQLRQRRQAIRFPPKQLSLVVRSPLAPDRVDHSLVDVQLDGLSFRADLDREVFPPGTRLDALALRLPDGREVRCPAVVRSCQPIAEGTPDAVSPARVGVQFTELPVAARDGILEELIRHRSPHCVNGAHVPFGDIWSMMESARYNFHPDYSFSDASRAYLPALAETHRRLYGDFGLGSSVAWVDEGRLIGQAAGLRIHSRTWLVQHLAVAPNFRRSEFVAHDISSLVVELAEALRDVDFIRYSWRLDNRYMTRLSGWLARVINQPNLSWVRQFTYLRRPSASGLPAPTVPVRAGTREDLQAIETHLRERGEVLRVASEDLNADELELGTLRARFGAAGLERSRKLWVTDLEGGGAVYLFAESGSPGINLIEKTNAMYFVVPDRQAAGVTEACRSLVAHAAAEYERRGRPSLVFLADDGDLELLGALGFESLGRFAEWFFHRSLIRTWYNLSRSLFERVERRDRSEGQS